jgi:hypothetical protein
VIYAFFSLGDSPVLSPSLAKGVEPSYLGAALGLRSLLGFGGVAIAPLAFFLDSLPIIRRQIRSMRSIDNFIFPNV